MEPENREPAAFIDVVLPYLTADIAGIGGAIKRFDEDFIVEEIPRYQASGEGTHVYFEIEKRGTTTSAAISLIAGALGRDRREIGYAGMKDAHGVTRQMLSLEHIGEEKIRELSFPRVKVVSITRHKNKIKLGHLSGNRFEIKIRDAQPGSLGCVEQILAILSFRGMPNYFGPQRFGARGDNALVGLAVLNNDYAEALEQMLGRPTGADRGTVAEARSLFSRGDLQAAEKLWARGFPDQARVCRALRTGGDARQAWRAVPQSLRRLYLSAVQSHLFNQVLACRIETLDRLVNGDVAWKHRNGASFAVEDAEVEQPRCGEFEISPTGPLHGRRMAEAVGEQGVLEAEVLGRSGLDAKQLSSGGGSRLDGGRRPLRVPLGELKSDEGQDDRGPFVRIVFTLPPGSYATSLAREVCKNDKIPPK